MTLGRVTLATPGDPGSSPFEILLGINPPKIVDGTGGWDIDPRLRAVGFTFFKGRNPVMMDLDLYFNAFPLGSVEGGLARLINYYATGGADFRQPSPVFTVSGPVPYVPLNGWVMGAPITYGEETEYTDDPENPVRSRQDLTLHLIEYVPSWVTENASKPKSAVKTYVVQQGDTLRKIARKKLHDPKRWTEIARLNKIRDGSTAALRKLVGKTIRIP